MKKRLKVLISILNWNNAESTIKCVKSVQKSNYKNYTIIVIDNNSTDNSLEKFKTKIPEIRLIKSNKNNGYAGGNALGAKFAIKNNFDLLWILNNDTIIFENTLQNLVNAAHNYPNAILGNLQIDTDNKIVFGGGYEFDELTKQNKTYNKFAGLTINKYQAINKTRKVCDVNGAGMAIPVQIIKKYGFIDTQFFLYAEELDYCFNLRNHYDIESYIITDSIIHHSPGSSFNTNTLKHKQTYYYIRNTIIFEKKYFNKTAKYYIQKQGGWRCFAKNIVLFCLINNSKKDGYYYKLAILHGILGLKGKRVKI